MATSGSKRVTVTPWNSLQFSWSETSQSIPNNTTTIYWKLELISGSSGRIDSSASKKWTVTINGTTHSGTNTIGIANNTTKTLAEGSDTIAHNANGTKTFSYSFSQQFSITFDGASIGTKTGSGSGTLDTIPRASSLTASNGTLGTSQTFTITRADSSFKHRITYTCGSASGYVIGSASTFTTATSIAWTPPLDLAQQNTTGSSVSITLKLLTFTNDGTQIGTATKSITCSIPASVKPTVSLDVSDPLGYVSKYGGYVQNLSKFAVSLTDAGSQGSTIKSRKTVIADKTFTSASFTTDIIQNSGSVTISTTVTDSRGRTATASITATVIPYSPPKINSLTVKRCDAAGNSSPGGAYLAVSFNSQVTELNNKNTAKYSIQYKKTSASQYTTETLSGFAGQYSVSNGVFIFAAETASSYNIIFTVTDAFGSAAKTATGASVFKLWSILNKGLGIAFGKIAEFEGVFDIGFKTKFTGGIQNIVLEKISDLNDVLVPNTYVSINKGATSYTNCPIESGTFVLEVMSAGAEGQVFQRLTTTFKDGKQECFERHYFGGSWGSWSCVYSDTGWVNLTLQSGISVGTEYGFLKGRLLNNVLYIQGDVIGISANWKYFAQVPAILLPSGLASANRIPAVYNMSNFCGLNLQSGGQLYVAANSAGSWDATKNLSVNFSICGN